jgi:small subunit ribosomal protein S1
MTEETNLPEDQANASQDAAADTPQQETASEASASKEDAPTESAAKAAPAKEEAAPEVKAAPAKEEAAPEVKAAPEAKAAPAKEQAAPEAKAEEAPAAEAPAEEAPAEEAPAAEEAPIKRVFVWEERQLEVPSDEFDWDQSDAEEDEMDPAERERLEVLYESSLTEISESEVVNGTVISIGKKEVVINIGHKSEGVVGASEFRYNDELKIGDVVPVFIETLEDHKGQLVVSHKTARIHSAWIDVNSALENNEIITGEVKCRTKGGLIVDVFGIEAFLPGSQIDVKPIRDYDQYVGMQMEFKVVKINQEYKNVVVSHKALIEAELEEQKRLIISKLEKGQVLEGIVKNITSYGVFVDLGGVDGLVHITDLSWGRVGHPEEVVEVEQKLNVVILDFDDDKKRIALGIKQLTSHPWDAMSEGINVGDKVKGKVVVVADYGAFVEVATGVEGLLHVSEMSWSQHLRSAQDFLKVGDEIETVILGMDMEERKMSLGMKQLVPDPWENIEFKYPEQSKHTGKVRNFTNFGLFVEMEEGIDGLVHISDLSWEKKIKHPSEFCNVGDDIEVVVLELDKSNRRMSLGHKQIQENPWDTFEKVFEVGSVHKGTVLKIDGSNAAVALPYGVEGFSQVKHLTKQDGGEVKAEEVADFVVLEFNRNAKRITVSHLRTYEEPPAQRRAASAPGEKKRSTSSGSSSSTKRAVREVNERQATTTFGDLGVLSKLKAQLEASGAKEEAAEKAPAKKAAAKKAPAKKAEVKAEAKAETATEAPEAVEAEKAEEAEEPAAKKAPAKKAAAKKPAAKKPAAKKPAAKKAPAKKAAKADDAEAKSDDEKK